MRVRRSSPALGVLLGFLLGAPTVPAVAQDGGWNPFKQWQQQDPPRPSKGLSRSDDPACRSRQAAALRATFGTAQPARSSSGELDPVMAPDNSGLPLELWRGLDLKAFEEQLLGGSTCRRARRRCISCGGACCCRRPRLPRARRAPTTSWRCGWRPSIARDCWATWTEVIDQAGSAGPLVLALSARNGHRPRPTRRGLPHDHGAGRTELRAARPAQGRDAAAGRLLRRRGRRCTGRRPRRQPGARGRHRGRAAAGRAGGRCQRQQAAGCACPSACCCSTTASSSCSVPSTRAQVFDKAEPALLAALAQDRNADARLKIAAAGAALRLNALTPEAVADLYRRHEFRRASCPIRPSADRPAAASCAVISRHRAVALARAAGAHGHACCSTMRGARRPPCRPRACWRRCSTT